MSANTAHWIEITIVLALLYGIGLAAVYAVVDRWRLRRARRNHH